MGDVADFVQVLFRILKAHSEAQEGLHVAREVLHTKRSLRRLGLQIIHKLLSFGLIAKHRRKRRGVLLHTRVVFHAFFEGSGHAATNRGDRMPDTLDPGDDGFGGKIGFQHVAENAGLGASGVHLVTEIIHRVLKTSCVLRRALGIVARTVCLVPEIGQGVVIRFEFALETVELSACVVELDLPILRPRIVLTKARGGVFECGAQGLNLGFLGLDFFAQHLVTGGECFGGLVVLIERGRHKLHLTAEHTHLTVNIRNRTLKLTLTLKPNLQTKTGVSHLLSLLITASFTGGRGW